MTKNAKLKIAVFCFASILICGLVFASCSKDNTIKADLVLLNGKIATVDDSNPYVEAVAVKADTIIALGSSEEIKKYIGDSTNVIDLKNAFAMPGFIESHAHLMELGEAQMQLKLQTARNWDEVIEMAAKARENASLGEWIVGQGWHQDKFNPKPMPSVEGYPVHNELSNAVPNNPVLFMHASGHALFANAKAMELAGITKETPDPPGGKIVRDSLGNAIGVFEENAMDLINNVYQKYLDQRTPEQVILHEIKSVQLAQDDCLRKGITSFHDAGETFAIIDFLKQLADSNELKIRLNVMVRDSFQAMQAKLKDYKLYGYGNNHLSVHSIKQYVDGALGSRGAWLLEPYSDMPSTSGFNVTPLDYLQKVADLAIQNGFQMCTHAIGDRGNREVLDIYENTFKKYPDKKDLRWRIEHAQHLSPQDIPRFAKLGVIAAMQTVHCTSDAVFVPKRLGDERSKEGAYVWRKLIDSGAVICDGTDAPVEDEDPIKCYYAAVTRKLADGSTFYPEEKMTRMEALKSYTTNGAYAAFEENIKGKLKPGMLADITVLSNDLLTVPDDQILNTKVLYTIVGGKILYDGIGSR